jgi:hypothetical protein
VGGFQIFSGAAAVAASKRPIARAYARRNKGVSRRESSRDGSIQPLKGPRTDCEGNGQSERTAKAPSGSRTCDRSDEGKRTYAGGMDSTAERDSCFRVRVRSDNARVGRVITIYATAALPAALAAFECISSFPPAVVDVSALHQTGQLEVSIEIASGTRYRLSVSPSSE